MVNLAVFATEQTLTATVWTKDCLLVSIYCQHFFLFVKNNQ